MNPTPPPAPFQCDEINLLGRHLHDAEAKAGIAESYPTQLASAQLAADKAEKAFIETLSADDAQALAAAQTRVTNLSLVVTAIDKAGGPKGIRDSALHVPAVYSTFAKGFEKRCCTIGPRIYALRKELGACRADLTERGNSLGGIEGDVEVQRLQSLLNRLDADLRNAQILLNYCGPNWVPATWSRSFTDLHGALIAPLPV